VPETGSTGPDAGSTGSKAGSAEPVSGVALLDKPAGLTSHQVVARIRRIVGTRKVGHAGTLDPLATGVLVVGINRATRLLGHLSLSDKSYAATIRLGISTVSDDADGEVTETRGAPAVSSEHLAAVLTSFRGDIEQVPASVSAIKVDGVRSHARVRAGQPVTMAARPVRIERLDLLARRDLVLDGLPVLDLDVLVECSSGTYVRALARDLGTTLATGGHLTALRRLRVGPFDIAEAQTLDQAEQDLTLIGLGPVARRCFATVTVDDDQASAVRVGRRLTGLRLPADPTALLTDDDELLALYRPDGDGARAVAVLVG
jgi:tRNA pseudouridine55 synthase